MSEIVNIHQAKTNLSKLVNRAHAGEVIVLAKNGTPYAKLAPLDSLEARKPGLVKGRLTDDFFEELPEDEFKVWGP